jgi:hypothetical protein
VLVRWTCRKCGKEGGMRRDAAAKAAIAAVAIAVCMTSVGCATIFHPSRSALRSDERGPLDPGMLVLDIVFTPGYGVLGLIIDFASGCMWMPNEKGIAKLNQLEHEEMADERPPSRQTSWREQEW